MLSKGAKGGPPLPLISVIVCTFDRPQSLRTTLESLVAQDMPPDGYEIIVVENGPRASGPDSDPADGPAIRYCHEPNPGLSNARNKGLSVASSDVVAFIDDDATAEPSWLSSLVRAFQDAPPEAACVGGRVLPDWQRPAPGWLRGGLFKYLGIVDLGDQRRAIDWPNEVLVGCNIAFRAAGLQAGGGFDPALGRRGSMLLSNEEIAVEQRIHETGGSIIYEPAAVVRHRIPAERMTLAWFMRRVYYQGISDAIYSRRYRLSSRVPPGRGRLTAVLSHRFRAALRTQPRMASALLALPYAAGVAIGSMRAASYAPPHRNVCEMP